MYYKDLVVLTIKQLGKSSLGACIEWRLLNCSFLNYRFSRVVMGITPGRAYAPQGQLESVLWRDRIAIVSASHR